MRTWLLPLFTCAGALLSAVMARGGSSGLFALLLFTACSNRLELPGHFTFGAAVAGFQVDMGCPTLSRSACDDPNSDWYQFATSTRTQGLSRAYLSGQSPSSGPGFFELYESDLDRAQSLGLTGFRFSIEWSRVFPESTAGIDGFESLRAKASPAALDYYHRLLSAIRARGMKPLVTLNHYTLPLWVHDAVGCTLDLDRCSPRGWLEPMIVPELAKYAGFIARELGDEVDTWATLNEPLAVVIPGYLMPTAERTNPPAHRLRVAEAKAAVLRMIEAHAQMVDAVRAHDTADADGDGQATFIGIVYPLAPVLPKDPENALDRRGALNADYLYNEAFLNAVLDGVLDEDLDGAGELQARLANRCDYLGVNYYYQVTVEGTDDSFIPEFSPRLTINPLTMRQGGYDPAGLQVMLRKVRAKWPRIPVIITENGADVAIEGGQERFLVQHLQALLAAIHEDEVEVRGYYWWSLTDNFEWNQGTRLKFGLFAVDPADPTKTRTARPITEILRQVAREGALDSALVDRFPLQKR